MAVYWNDGCYHHVKSDNELFNTCFRIYIHLVFFIVMYVNMYRKAVIEYYDSVMVTRYQISLLSMEIYVLNICFIYLMIYIYISSFIKTIMELSNI